MRVYTYVRSRETKKGREIVAYIYIYIWLIYMKRHTRALDMLARMLTPGYRIISILNPIDVP